MKAVVSFIGYHKFECSMIQRQFWRCLSLIGLLLLLLVTYSYVNQLLTMRYHHNHLATSGHTQTKMLVEPSATAIHIPENQIKTISDLDEEHDQVNTLLNSKKQFNNFNMYKNSLLHDRNGQLMPVVNSDSDCCATVESVPLTKVLGAPCDKIIQGDLNALLDASSYKQNNQYIPIQDMRYSEFTSNCETFRRDRQYMMQSVSSEEEEFPIAYSILMYKDVEQFERLLRAIYRPQNYYCIHVDVKSSFDVKNSVNSIARCFKNVFLAVKSIDVQWGTYSVLEPEIICMENLWKYKKWKYFINLTGQEFPLKTNLDIVKILKVLNGTNSVEGTINRRNKERTDYVYEGIMRTSQRKSHVPVAVTLSKGSIHITVSRAFIDYILHDNRALQFRNWVKDTGYPDETFFSSLNHSPQLEVPGAYKGEPETDQVHYPFITRFKNWGMYPFNWPCYGRRVRMICVFGIQDLKFLSNRPELFANKFYLDYEPLTFQCLEELHYNRTRSEIIGKRHFDTTPYENMDFVKNHV